MESCRPRCARTRIAIPLPEREQGNGALHLGTSYSSARRAVMRQLDTPAETAQSAVSRSVPDTRFHGYRLGMVRLLCLCLYLLSVGLVLVSIPPYFASLHVLCTG